MQYYFKNEVLGNDYSRLTDVEVDLIFRGRLLGTEGNIIVFSHGREGEFGNYILNNFRFPFDILYGNNVDYDKYAVIEIIYTSVWRSLNDPLRPDCAHFAGLNSSPWSQFGSFWLKAV